MTKAEKVIKELRWLQFNFPWQENPENDADKMFNAIHKYTGDAIDLFNDALGLLKEQEQVLVHSSEYHGMRYAECPKCHERIDSLVNKHFCGNCGKAVKWNDEV